MWSWEWGGNAVDFLPTVVKIEGNASGPVASAIMAGLYEAIQVAGEAAPQAFVSVAVRGDDGPQGGHATVSFSVAPPKPPPGDVENPVAVAVDEPAPVIMPEVGPEVPTPSVPAP